MSLVKWNGIERGRRQSGGDVEGSGSEESQDRIKRKDSREMIR